MDKNLEDYIDFLVDVKIPHDKITILTGKNASGKSLIRKLLSTQISKALKKEKVFIPHASQEVRTNSNPESIVHDLDWLATSHNTIHTINMVFNSDNPDFIVIDEPEIGLGEELQLGLAHHLNELIASLKCGVLIITHSRHIVNNLKHDGFINLENMTETEWLNREITPINVEEFKDFASKLHRAIQDRINNNKNKS